MILLGYLRDEFGQIAEINVLSDDAKRYDNGVFERKISGVVEGDCQKLKQFVDWRWAHKPVVLDGREFVEVELWLGLGVRKKRVYLSVQGDQIHLVDRMQMLTKSDVQMAFKCLMSMEKHPLPDLLEKVERLFNEVPPESPLE